ncbi:helix-turn-helix domain-containing protein [Weizmannia agrestimuris]|uniref:helix-turn-helix domain-containing protein n=1 Tax=Weizmannia agrestimuris TaxID=2941342 RepID=UPI00203A7FCA|nr:helix-turn-helix transcriptional regulator [Weizmannia agrestimuris]
MQLSKELIRFIRQNNRLSQREFADRIGVSNSYIALVENGIKPVTPNLSKKITKEFDIDVDYIEAARRFIDV